MPDFQETDFIVLRKVNYSASSLIVSGISPEYGQIGFFVRGAADSSRGRRTVLDLYRLLHVQFKPSNGGLHTPVLIDLLEDFGALAGRYESFQAAAWLASFSLLNVMEMLPHPHYANALEVALRRLAANTLSSPAILTGACMAFLFEEGWLAHAIQDKRSSEQCRLILEMAAGKDAPDITRECWEQQFAWCRELLLYNECRLPG